ncbi:MAG: ABC transporter substrate-binding protein [Rhizobiales bacterium]|nr:ABC transporter substrate-binding protein [Hyphomicrobiales bacterium]
MTDAERIRAIGEAIGRNADIKLLGRLALGRLWRQLSDAQRQRYADHFPGYVKRTLASQLVAAAGDVDGALDDHVQLHGGEAAGKGDIIVHSKIIPTEGQPAAVGWRLRHVEGTLSIIDLLTDGVSLLVTKRSEFAAVVEQGSIDDLLAELEANAGS